MRLWAFLLALSFASCALAQENGAPLHGTWTATVGPSQVFRGTWTGHTLPRNANSARGSWSLVIDTDQSVIQGTWTAQKSGEEWRGTWAARTQQGRSLTGSWNSSDTNLSGKTFQDLLQRAMEKEIAGNWRTGAYTGGWWLRGPPKQERSR